MVAGRGIAQLITGGQIITDQQRPVQVHRRRLLARAAVRASSSRAACVAVTALLTRRTALGMLIESVGGNAEASRLAGIRSRGPDHARLRVLRALRGIAGFMISSNINGADGNNAGLWIELDAILAVVIGGTSLAGGRFSLGGTVVGALVIQTLTTTIYSIGIPPETTLLFKALVVIVVCLLQSPGVPRQAAAPPQATPRPAAAGARPIEPVRGRRPRCPA